MVKQLLKFSYTYPKLVLLLLILLTAAATPNLQYLKFDISAQSLMVKSSTSWTDYQQSLAEFGSDAVVIVVVSDPELFSAAKLDKVKQALNLLQELDFIKATSSLFDVPNVQEVDGYIETRAFLDEFPQDSVQSERLIDDALANTLVADNLVSRDRQTMALNLIIDSDGHYPGRDHDITLAIEDVLTQLDKDIDKVYQMSSPYVRDQISNQIEQDIESILPAALAILIVVLGLSMGRLNCSIVPMSTSLISIVLTLAFMAQMGIALNVLTSIIPALLIIIGSTEDVHLMAEYHAGLKRGLTREQAVKLLPVNQSLAIMLAFVTTFIGFLSITVSDLQMLQQFGWLVAFGLLVNFMVTILFVPAYLILFGGRGKGYKAQRNLFQKMTGVIFQLVMRFKKATLLLLLLMIGYFLWGTQYLFVNHSALAYFSPQSEIRQRAENIHQNLSGMQTFSIILDSSIEGTFYKVRYLEEIERLQQFIDERGVFDKSFSFADFIKLTHRVMEGIDEPQLPLDDEVVQVYMEFVQPEAVDSYVNDDYSSARVLVRHNITSSRQLKQEFNEIRQFLEQELQTSLKVTLTGESVLDNHAADALAFGQIQSLVLMVIVIQLLVSVLFVDFRAGLIALIPNVFPVIVLFGVMGYFQIPLDSGTTMVAAIALGICVDDTIHFLSRYHSFTRGTSDVQLALQKTIEHESTPITTTSVALTLGFLTLTLSSFEPVQYFGALSALVMVLAMFATFVLTPVLLSFTKLITVWDMLSLNIKADVLKNSPIFKGLKNFQIKQAILSGSLKQFAAGEMIIDQGIAGNEFFVLLEGAALATHRDEDGSIHTLSHLAAGDLFGEVAQLSQRERMARVTATEDTRVLEMKWSSIQQIGTYHPRISMRLYRNLAEVLSQRLVQVSADRRKPRDELTGALTKPFLCEILSQEIKRSHHFAENISLMLLDIEIIPREGELTGELSDQVIAEVTRIIRDHMQPTDVFARWDQCGFMVILPRADAGKAVSFGETIRHAIETVEVSTQVRLHINTAVAQISDQETSQEAIQRLEIQLQKLKEKSLNIAIA
ncbi:MAG: MMPL family transporter [Gammaproteobacteria bacterium]|nr:MMPL family transporter [Gammaproteobacteria bacterium]